MSGLSVAAMVVRIVGDVDPAVDPAVVEAAVVAVCDRMGVDPHQRVPASVWHEAADLLDPL